MSDLPEEIQKSTSFDEFRKLVPSQSDFLSRLKYIKGAELTPISIAVFEAYIEPFCNEKDRYIELCGKALYEDKTNIDAVLKEMKRWTSPGIFSNFELGTAAMFDHARQIYFHYDQKSRILAAADEAYSTSLDGFFKGKSIAEEDQKIITERIKTVLKAAAELESIMRRYGGKE